MSVTKKLMTSMLVVTTFFPNMVYGMQEEESSSHHHAKLITEKEPKTDNNSSRSSSGSSNHEVQLTVEEDREETEFKVSLGTRIQGYCARCATIGCCTFVGGAIGLAIVSGELSPTIAMSLLKVGSPILFGTLVGYGVGWGCGNTFKSRITGKC